jgi:hypothetical protein
VTKRNVNELDWKKDLTPANTEKGQVILRSGKVSRPWKKYARL